MADGVIRLPWPDPSMWPNSRKDRRAVARIRKQYRADGAKATWAAGFSNVKWERAHLLITFCPPTNGKRDLDNMLAAIKSGLDGVADALGVDDGAWDLTIRRGCKVAGGQVQIELGPPVDNDFVQFRGVVT